MTLQEAYFASLRKGFRYGESSNAKAAPPLYVEALESISDAKLSFDIAARLEGRDPKFKGRIWWISDLHLGHAAIIGFSERPYHTVGEMNADILRRILSRVTEEDVIIFVGDLMVTRKDGGGVDEVNAILHSILAHKVLVLGNHDINESRGGLLRLHVDEVVPYIEFTYRGIKFWVTHYPIHAHLLPPGVLNIHGHVHRSVLHPSVSEGKGRHVNVCCEVTNYEPQQLEDLLTPKQKGMLK